MRRVFRVKPAVRVSKADPAQPPDPAASSRFRFRGLSRPIRLPRNSPELTEGLVRILNGWTATGEPASGGEETADLCCVIPDGIGTFTVRSPFVSDPLERLPIASAICAIAADLAQGYFEERPGSLALHCGAFRIGDRLIALAGAARAGKSTFAARLLMEPDIDVFCDDVLPIDASGFGVGLGLAPRIRIPLPTAISDRFRIYVDQHMGPVDDRYGYVVSDNIVAHGTRAPLSAIVALRRIRGARARLHRLDPADAVQLIAEQNMANLQTAQHAFERISAMVEGLQRFTLVYSDLEEAVDLIRRTFDPRSTGLDADELAPSMRRKVPPSSRAALSDLRPFVWKRREDVDLRHVDGAAFLFRHDDNILWRMNNLAAAVWAVLEAPSRIDDLVELISEAFPRKPRTALQSDLVLLFETLAAENMIEKAR